MGKQPISATIDEELVKWIEKEIQDRTKNRNKSHLIEIALELLKKEGIDVFYVLISSKKSTDI